jgi:phage-related protein
VVAKVVGMGGRVRGAFEKRTRKTPPQELKLARDRYRALVKKRADDAKKK